MLTNLPFIEFLTECAIWAFTIATALQIFYFLFFYARLAFYKKNNTTSTKKSTTNLKNNQPPVTILICAHNEAENLAANLDRILNQTYRSYQVLVINHNSTDESEKILRHLQQTYSHLDFKNFTNTKKTQVGKKFALAYGIEKARHEVLLLTDADCMPESTDWLQKMQQLLRDDVEIGLGFGPYQKQPGFLNKLIRFETNLTATQYFSFALAGMPYMGVGRNMIYKKELYENATDFKKHDDLASGDDDLFINEVANANNTRIILDPDTFVYSPPKLTWRAWFRQKSRHLTAGRRYRFQHQILLGLASSSHILHYVTGIFVACQGYFALAIALYLVRTILMLLIFGEIFRKLDDAILLKWLPFIDAAFVLYYMLLAPAIFFGNKQRW
jgi:cellulose synthase/poly-beta-1,6-N-acetylglucosamine synthase-like glycosyltransferase